MPEFPAIEFWLGSAGWELKREVEETHSMFVRLTGRFPSILTRIGFFCERGLSAVAERAVAGFNIRPGKKESCGIRYEARSRGRSSPNLVFLSLQNAQTIELTTTWTAVSSSQCRHQVLVFTLEWSWARPMGEQW